ncbi:MAG: hypothetical protein AAGA35_02195 [Patescibacteria group bacterium]
MIGRFFAIFCFLPITALAAASPQYELSQEQIGGTEFSGSSVNYEFRAIIGEAINSFSNSASYLLDQGRTWLSYVAPTGSSTVTIQYAVPEGRVGVEQTNDDTVFYLSIRTADDADDVVLFTTALATTSVDGTYLADIDLTSVATGTYDIGFKGSQHLTRVLQDVPIGFGSTTLNFSTTDYASTTRGSIRLLAGDVNGAGDSAATLGDDVVNSVDLSAILAVLDDSDATGNGIRANLNQDTAVNSVDLSIMLDNLDAQGDN